MTFFYPPDGSIKTILLKDPEWQDSVVAKLNQGFSTMMNGDVRSRRTTPTTTRLTFTLSDLTRRKSLELRDFIQAASGHEVRLNAFDGKAWVGFILTDPFQVTTDGRGQGSEARKETNTTYIDFEGIRL